MEKGGGTEVDEQTENKVVDEKGGGKWVVEDDT